MGETHTDTRFTHTHRGAQKKKSLEAVCLSECSDWLREAETFLQTFRQWQGFAEAALA